MDQRAISEDNTKKYTKYIVIAVLAILAIVLGLGRIEFHNELERDVIPGALIGYMDDERYFGTLTVSSADWPQWTEAFDRPDETTVTFEYDVLGGRIGIFADLVYYENRYELRTWFSGKLLEHASEYYYKPEGALYLQPVYELNREPDIPLEQLVPQQYDYMAFKSD